MNEIRRERSAVVATDGRRRISWGAIIAGALLALAIQFMLGLLGLGIGLATIDPQGAESFDPNSFASVGGLWTIAVVLIGLFVGAYAAGRLSGSLTRIDAILHGVVTWATSTLFVVFLLTTGASAVVGAAFGVIGGSIQGLSAAAATVAPETTSTLRRDAEEALRRGGGASRPPADSADEADVPVIGETQPVPVEQDSAATSIGTVLAGLGEQATPQQRQAASQAIARQAGISQQEAQQRLQQLQQAYDSAKREARVAADAAARAVTAASFAAFVALALGLTVGALGGLVGRPRGLPVAGRV
ncbi:hypothetical protein [Aurantimonas marina]|uniref:hypothetical protein n=1 Tax=Aurantimonas marina TaxID=2780508 RepID=UPI0019D131F7|nr:hypothetical protein [Aurantimonas marina]